MDHQLTSPHWMKVIKRPQGVRSKAGFRSSMRSASGLNARSLRRTLARLATCIGPRQNGTIDPETNVPQPQLQRPTVTGVIPEPMAMLKVSHVLDADAKANHSKHATKGSNPNNTFVM